MSNFNQLIDTLARIHRQLQASALGAVNQALTIRNWLIGYYIVEFEQGGEDRAEYGSRLLTKIAHNLKIKGLSAPELSRCRQFYLAYPQILGTLTQKFKDQLSDTIFGTLSQKLVESTNRIVVGSASPQSLKGIFVPGEKIIQRLSFSHLVELIKINDPLKRTFYEIECIKCTWSVRELKRQVSSQYFERSGLSTKPEKLAAMIQKNRTPRAPADVIKNVYAFEFLGLNTKELFEESDLETALLDHLQQFIIELGNGFCFEARQKRLLIGDHYYFLDLLFYHRILKCHVILELKLGAFEHGDIGQLNSVRL